MTTVIANIERQQIPKREGFHKNVSDKPHWYIKKLNSLFGKKVKFTVPYSVTRNYGSLHFVKLQKFGFIGSVTSMDSLSKE